MVQTLSLNSPNAAFGVYIAALLVFSVNAISAKKWSLAFGTILLSLGFIAHTAFILYRWIEGNHPPFSNQYESLIVFAWWVVALVLFFGFRLPRTNEVHGWLKIGGTLLTLIILGVASFLDPKITPLVPALQSNWLTFHVLVSFLGYGSFGLAAVAGTGIVLCHKKPAGESWENIGYNSTVLGFLFLTLGIIAGAIWANSAWGTYWSWDPKETWSLITWFVYAIALHLRFTRNWKGPKFAWVLISGFGFVLFTYFGVNYILSGLHSYA